MTADGSKAWGQESLAAGFPRVLVVLAHPDERSLNGAVAAAVVAGVERAGGEPLLHDLYRDGFDPRLSADEVAQQTRGAEEAARAPVRFADALTARYARDLVRAHAIVVVHPVWFFHVPAILKGWVDRVVREGVAFEVRPDGHVHGLLRAGSALVVTTANTSQAGEAAAFGAPLDTFWRDIVFGPAGVGEVERLALAPVRASEAATRATWLAEAEARAAGLTRAASAAARLGGDLD